MGRTPNQIGSDAEERAAKVLGGRLVPGSGSTKFIKLDVHDKGKFIYSVKASESLAQTSLRAIAKLWREAIRGARGFSGHGDGARPAMVFEVDGELLALVRLDDHAELARGEAAPYIPPDAAQERRTRSRRSLLG